MAEANSAKPARFGTLGAVVLFIAALYWAREILVPLALAILFSFLLAPLEYRLRRLWLPRVLSVLVTVVISFAALGGIGYVVYNQMADFANHLPRYQETIKAKVDSIRNGGGFFASVERAGQEVQHIFATTTTSPSEEKESRPFPKPLPVIVTNYQPVTNSSTGPLQLIADIGGMVLGPVGTGLLVAIFTIFMLLQREDLRDRVLRLVGLDQLTTTTQVLDDAAARVSRYLAMQFILNGAVGLAVFLSLWLIGKINGRPFPSPALFGLLAALLRFIPYLGIWIAASFPLLISFAAYSALGVTLETVAAFVTIEVIAANVFEPIMFGSSTGITGLAVLVSAMFWTWLWGPVGLLLATPLTVCVVVMGKYVPALSFLNILLSDEPALEPPDRVYQRLLALDQTEARELVDEYAKKMPIEELYDTLLIPVLATTERERHIGNLDEAHHAAILKDVRKLVEELGQRERDLIAKTIKSPIDEPDEEEDARPAERRGMLPRGAAVKALCLPGHDDSDEIASMMFGQLLELRGFVVTLAAVDQLTSEMVDTVEKSQTDLVCISALPPAAIRHVRYLCKRLHEKMPSVELIIGLWTTQLSQPELRDRLACDGNVQACGSLREGLKHAHQIAQAKMVDGAK
jgi:predicted PurR-regulated permease PerM